MRLRGADYSKRLSSFSDFTLVLVSIMNGMSEDVACKGSDITTDSDLTEEEIISKLMALVDANSNKPSSISCDDALEILCDALEAGYFHSLYEILDRNATLVFVDDDKPIDGVRDIINFLVKERLDHLYPSDEPTITCDILMVTAGERYGIGEKCILLVYHLENGKREHYIVKVHVLDDVINKIEIFNPYGPLSLEA